MGHVKALPRVEPAGLSSTDVPQNMGVARFVEHPSAPLASSVKRERSPSSEDALATIEEAPRIWAHMAPYLEQDSVRAVITTGITQMSEVIIGGLERLDSPEVQASIVATIEAELAAEAERRG